MLLSEWKHKVSAISCTLYEVWLGLSPIQITVSLFYKWCCTLWVLGFCSSAVKVSVPMGYGAHQWVISAWCSETVYWSLHQWLNVQWRMFIHWIFTPCRQDHYAASKHGASVTQWAVPYPSTMETLVLHCFNKQRSKEKLISDFVGSSNVQGRMFQIY
jgi:hypothetical protein